MPGMLLSRRGAVVVFTVFACAYFLSTLIRAITATLAPTLSLEFSLQAADLGLLAGGYFMGFALTQLPLGRWLDRHGPKKVLIGFLTMAVAGCLAFSVATDFNGLLAARVLCGVGVSACLMAPLTGYRRWLSPGLLVRANSWMLMVGSIGLLASTLPVQWLLPVMGWRPIFWGLAGLALAVIVLVAWLVPPWETPGASGGAGPAHPASASAEGLWASYREVWRHPYFRRAAPIGFFGYAGLVAMQTLWAGPWMVRVAGYSAGEAAAGLFTINAVMLVAFWAWGAFTPWLADRGWDTTRLIAWGHPTSFVVLVGLILAGPAAGAWTWTLFCLASSFVSLAQPSVGMAFPSALAGRALSAYNLVIFLGIFVVQWGVGLLIDAFKAAGWTEVDSFRGAMAVFLVTSVLSWLWFLRAPQDNGAR
jgi:MFS family permease